MKKLLENPILKGYYPDPSICRVDDDYYLVCSSFEMTPGLPVFHSRDLAHWKQIGNALTEDNHFHIERDGGVGGIMAPTIRYHKGTYYIIDTNLADKGNFIITASDPAGPWSEPHWLKDIPDIDASLFFDDDGQVYIIGIGNVWENGFGEKERGFWIARFDIETFTMISEPVCIFNSALRHGDSPESPHIYHVGEYYYLLFAEGGTEHYHAVMAARSKNLFDFFEGNPANPVMTHRHMGYNSPIINIGHADLVELPDGSWYAVMLGSRLVDGSHKNLGRETFICPVVWEKGWPLFSPETGRVEAAYKMPECLEYGADVKENERDDFDSENLPLYMNFWGTPHKNMWKIEESCLKLRCIAQTPDDDIVPMDLSEKTYDDRYAAFVSRRLCAMHAEVSCAMHFRPQDTESAGLAITQALNHQIHIERAVENGEHALRVVLITADYNGYPFFPGFESVTHREVLYSLAYEGDDVVLQVDMNYQDYTVHYGQDENHMTELCKLDGRLINPEKVGCMCGTLLAMYATGNGIDSEKYAEFDWFRYKEIEV